MQQVASKAPEVDLIVLYAFDDNYEPSLHVRLLDPLSLLTKFADSLRLLEVSSPSSLTALGQDMGGLIETRLSGTHPQSAYTLYFDGFLFDELNGLTTLVLANNQTSQLILAESSTYYPLVAQYFAVTRSEYTLVTSLNASQVKRLLNEFFVSQNVPSSINFSQTAVQLDSNKMSFTVTRQGNPYAPSLITSAGLVVGIFVLLVLYIRRRFLDLQLQDLAAQRNANAWLNSYEKASFLLYGLRNKWRAQASYWQRLQKESEALARKAKLYFDAGDINTTKLFITKALHANTANKQAKKLLKAIEQIDSDAKSITENEQWIRNKLAKAMNNYRQQEPIKALRQLHQALAVAKKEKSLKKQTKAIGKLTKQIKQEYAQNVNSVLITLNKAPQSLLLCYNENLHLGRRSNREGETWISNQDAVFYLNHKSISRAGQQGYVQKTPTGFYWIDSSSKNGSYVNNELATPHQPVLLHNNDLLQLGGNNKILSAALSIELSQQQTVLQMSVQLQSMTQLDKQELNQVWPENALAAKTKLVCLQTICWLVFDTKQQSIEICEEGELSSANNENIHKSSHHKINKNRQKNAQKTQRIPLCALSLGKSATISPIAPKAIKAALGKAVSNSALKLNGQELNGEVPLVFPCSLAYEELHFQISNYDSVSMHYGHGAIVSSKPNIALKSNRIDDQQQDSN
jgi:pSer/pThr/pTyr-binding forkhead associated (FHA) protein